MKKILILILLVSCTTLFSQNITKETAIKVAKNFYYERVNSQQSSDLNDIIVDNVIEEKLSGKTLIYIVDFEFEGFVILSGNTNTKPILGYSFDGIYDNSNIPPQMRDWLDQYLLQLEYMQQHPEITNTEFAGEWKRLQSDNPEEFKIFKGKDLEPMLTTTWDQGTYYNELCPADPAGPGGHCVTGCVATALAQLMNYFRWPETGVGSYSYECPPYGTLSANFGETEYKWDEMAVNLTASNLATALIISHLGISVDMVYGPNGSGMYNHKAAYTLRTFFKYDPSCIYVYRDSTNMDWDSLLVTNLDKHIPMYYAGWSVPNINGHAFIVDGYQSGNYYHFNWGWSGSYDGYFYTNAMNPGGSNFNLAQELVINAVPDTNLYQYPIYCNGDKTTITTDGTIDDGSGPLYNYQDGSMCTWLIAPEDSVNNITLNFLKFDTEFNDKLRVYDGENAGGILLGEFSGNTIPGNITSSSDKLFITFNSDNANTSPGWLMSYTSDIPVYCSGMVTMTEASGEFSDGSGPRDYHNSTTCIWRIEPVTDPEVLMIEFSEFNTEEVNDVVKIYDGVSQELLAEYSGEYPNLPPSVIVESKKAFLTWSTNTTVTAPGWSAQYYMQMIGVKENEDKIELNVYPNPANQLVNINILSRNEQNMNYTLFNTTGKTFLKSDIHLNSGYNKESINISGLEKGVYFFCINTEKESIIKKIVVL